VHDRRVAPGEALVGRPQVGVRVDLQHAQPGPPGGRRRDPAVRHRVVATDHARDPALIQNRRDPLAHPRVDAGTGSIHLGDDRGIVAILDPRIRTKSYGRGILRALPPARIAAGGMDTLHTIHRELFRDP